MGFFQGVVQQLNTIDDRNERFAKEERDRAEQRKARQEALLKSRTDAIVQLAASGTISNEAMLGYLSEIGAGSSTDESTKGSKKEPALTVPKPSEKKLPGGVKIETSLKPSSIVAQKGQELIKRYNLDPEKVAKFVARGPTHVDDLMDLMKTAYAAYKSAGREAEWTPKVANEALNSLLVFADDTSKTLDREELDRILGFTTNPVEKAYYRALLSGKKQKTSVANFYTPPPFFSLEEYNKANESFTKAITQTLLEAERKLQRNQPEDTASAEERREHGERLATIKRQIIDAKDGIIAPDVIEQYGPILFETFKISVSPKIGMQENLPGILGSSRRALNAVPEFDTIDEAREAVERGEARYDYPVRIGGQLGILERD